MRAALERQLVLIEYSSAPHKTRPFAERAGWLTDEDVFDAVLRCAPEAVVSGHGMLGNRGKRLPADFGAASLLAPRRGGKG